MTFVQKDTCIRKQGTRNTTTTLLATPRKTSGCTANFKDVSALRHYEEIFHVHHSLLESVSLQLYGLVLLCFSFATITTPFF